MKRACQFLLVLPFVGLSFVQGQSFVNGDLNGTIGISAAPTSWGQVPYGDPASQSTGTLQATSDLCNTTGPDAFNGINGNPYSGLTFTSGLHMSNIGWVWHEGIQQTVTGLTVGTNYTVSFFQTVIKQSNGLDQTGSWAVYRDNTLLGVSTISNGPLPYNSTAHIWDRRTVTFTATSTSHTIKFLPRDNDADISSPNEGLRMGIDSVTLRVTVVLDEAMDFELAAEGKEVILSWKGAEGNNVSEYLIERSPDGLYFETAGVVTGMAGADLRFVDTKPFVQSQYRIGRVNHDGSITYSEVKSIHSELPLAAVVEGRTLRIWGGYGNGYEVRLYDLQGRELLTTRTEEEVDLGTMRSGIYLLRVLSEGRERLVLEKKLMLRE